MTLATTDLACHRMGTPKFYPDVRISQAEYTGGGNQHIWHALQNLHSKRTYLKLEARTSFREDVLCLFLSKLNSQTVIFFLFFF